MKRILLCVLITLFAGSVQARDLDQYLVGCWPGIKNEAGNVHDFSGNANHGTPTNVAWEEGPRGQVAVFNGADAKVNCGNILNPGTADFTFSCWIKLEGAGLRVVINKWRNAGNKEGFYLRINASGQIYFYVDGNGAAGDHVGCLSNDIVSISNWTHIVGVWDYDVGATIYINGLFDNSTAGTTAGSVSTSRNLYFGLYSDGVTDWFDGSMAELQLYNTILTADEVERLYRQSPRRSVLVPSGKMRMYHEFNGTSGFMTGGDICDMSTNDIILSAWIQTVATSKQPIIYKSGAGGYYDLHLNLTTGYLQCVINDGGNTATATGDVAVNDGLVYHVVAIIDKSEAPGMRLYIDGIEDVSARANPTSVGDIDNDGDLQLGYDGTDYFDGIISSVRLFNAISAIPLNDAAELYTFLNQPVSLSGELGHWPLNDNQGFLSDDLTDANQDLTQVTIANQPAIITDLSPKRWTDTIFSEAFDSGRLGDNWTVESGSFEVIYIDSLDMYAAKCVTAGVLGVVLPQQISDLTESNWELEWRMFKAADGNELSINFIANSLSAAATGYRWQFSTDERIILDEVGVANLTKTNASYISIDTWYTEKIRHSVGDVFSLYHDGTKIADGDLDNNNDVTDTTTETTVYWLIEADAGDMIAQPLTRRY